MIPAPSLILVNVIWSVATTCPLIVAVTATVKVFSKPDALIVKLSVELKSSLLTDHFQFALMSLLPFCSVALTVVLPSWFLKTTPLSVDNLIVYGFACSTSSSSRFCIPSESWFSNALKLAKVVLLLCGLVKLIFWSDTLASTINTGLKPSSWILTVSPISTSTNPSTS